MPVSTKTAYEKNMKVALKFISGAIARPSLKGVYHHPDGRLIATDGLCLISIDDGYEVSDENKLARQIVNKEGRFIDGQYPDTDRITWQHAKTEVKSASVPDWIRAHDDAYKGVRDRKIEIERTRSNGEKYKKLIKDDSYGVDLRLDREDGAPAVLRYGYMNDGSGQWVPGAREDELWYSSRRVGDKLEIRYNCKLMLKALRALKQLGHKEFDISFKGDKQAMKLTAPGILILVSPLLKK